MKAYGRVKIYLHSVFTLSLHGDEWFNLRPQPLYPPFNGRLDVPQRGTYRHLNPRKLSPWVSPNTIFATPEHLCLKIRKQNEIHSVMIGVYLVDTCREAIQINYADSRTRAVLQTFILNISVADSPQFHEF
jgi:hypothetical protein